MHQKNEVILQKVTKIDSSAVRRLVMKKLDQPLQATSETAVASFIEKHHATMEELIQ